ncbi:thiolase domain-containing protein [Amycolatopsis rhizosphaerae]|uniref:Thiolase domain-containing protein n=2 Tax=Amycolatopsis rhizosphaerae TaxID=2053003 RepID=A0A558B9P1_9PSEU|nr:thiolase domain-containing protein [Amycolatopsis rhizosphaerae]TVT33204.1 thiolase domain-containing protein [Amycolatopsis rhizosphaerae]
MTTRFSRTGRIGIVGVAHTPFGRLTTETVSSLVERVTTEALADANVDPGAIDEVFVAQFNSGLTPFAFPSSLPLGASDGLWGRPMTRVENACASGSAAVHQGVRALLSGLAETVLVVGVEKMTHAPGAEVSRALLGADPRLAGTDSPAGFAGVFAEVAEKYIKRYDAGEWLPDVLGAIAAKNHRNGCANPWAQIRKDLGAAFCSTVSEANPLVAGPLRRTDCSPVSDGAAAIVLRRDPADPLAIVAGIGHANDHLDPSRRDVLEFAAGRLAVGRAFGMARAGLDDLDLAEVHDCFTIAELLVYEMLGLTPRGEGRRAVEEGWVHRDGRLPVNVSGGLKAKGHPVGATGVSQHVMVALQLSGRAGDLQLAGPRTGLVHNMGGLAVANYATVLRG